MSRASRQGRDKVITMSPESVTFRQDFERTGRSLEGRMEGDAELLFAETG
jgi:hypothetical protein